MRSKLFTLILSLVAVTALAVAGGKDGKVTGVISGAHCGAMSMVCSPSHDLRRAELPGVYTKDNKFYVLANMPRTFLAHWPGKDVTVEGTVYETELVIDAKKVAIRSGEKWQTVFEVGSIVDDMGHGEKLANAVEIDGKWYCANCAATHQEAKK